MKIPLLDNVKMTLLLAISIVSLGVVADAQTLNRVLQFGTAGGDAIHGSVLDGEGSLYVVGKTGGSLPGLTSAGGADCFLRKYDSTFAPVWTRQFGTAGEDVAWGVALDHLGNIYVGGVSGGALPDQTGSGEGFLRKYDRTGNVVWTRAFDAQVYEVAFDPAGEIVVGGAEREGTSGGSIASLRRFSLDGQETYHSPSHNSFGRAEHVTALTTNVRGRVVVGSTFYNFRGPDRATVDGKALGDWSHVSGLAGDLQGNLYAAGDGPPGAGTSFPALANLMKFAADGTVLWSRSMPPSVPANGQGSRATAVAVDQEGSAYVVVQVGSAIDGQTALGETDVLVRKYGADGSEIWTRQLGTSAADSPNAVIVTPGGQVIVAGVTAGTFAGQTSAGGEDAFLLVVDQPAATPKGLHFIPVLPCRVLETRIGFSGTRWTGAFGPPRLSAGATRTLPLAAFQPCGVPGTAKAVVVNATIDTLHESTGPVELVTIWPAGETRPDFTNLRTSTGGYIANSTIVKTGGNGTLSLYTSRDTNLLLDVSGYFSDDPADLPFGLRYYPTNPCRAVDTRGPVYSSLPPPYGNSRFQSRENRTLRLPGSPGCTLPAASAYSVQLTLVPGELTNGGPVAYITAYPSGTPQPGVSNMNGVFGYAVANSAIVPASPNGSIDVFAYDATNLIVDVNGYFAPDDGTRRGLLYYPVRQCRVMNTQDLTFLGPFGLPAMTAGTDRTVPIPQSRCQGLPTTAAAWALNAAVAPIGPMPFLSLWPSGTPWPNISQLNAFQGQTVANGAIVPASATGSVDVRVAATTGVALEVAGYFGR